MFSTAALDLAVPLFFTRDIRSIDTRTELDDAVRHGRLLRLRRGVYVDAAHWAGLDRHDRYRLLVTAAARQSPRPLVFARESAAALWRLPRLGAWPDKVHVVTERATGGRSNAAIARHGVGAPFEYLEIDGHRVTTLSRTVVDIARSSPFAVAVATADAALRRRDHPAAGMPEAAVTASTLMAELADVPLRHGRAKARAVIQFADGRADRPGESLSRVTIHVLELPKPELQAVLYGVSGRRYVVDFWWPEFDAIGEFDGRYKYTDPEFLQGRTPERAVYDEKLREDDLRAAHRGFARWDMRIAASPALLRDRLARAGVARA